MENKKYIKQMQKQIIDLKKYIVQLENTLRNFEKLNEHLYCQKLVLINENKKLKQLLEETKRKIGLFY